MGRKGNAKDAEELKRLCERHPAVDRVEDRTKHWLVFPKDKAQMPVVLAKTPSDWRTVLNTRAALRRAGIELSIPKPSSKQKRREARLVE